MIIFGIYMKMCIIYTCMYMYIPVSKLPTINALEVRINKSAHLYRYSHTIIHLCKREREREGGGGGGGGVRKRGQGGCMQTSRYSYNLCAIMYN